MHILLIHQAFATLDEPGGTRHHELSRHLVALGHRVTVLTGQVSYLTGQHTASGWVQREVDDLGVVIWRCYSYPAWHRSFIHRILSFFSFMISSLVNGIRVREIDLVWGTSPPLFQGFTAWLLARLKRARFLFEVRDLWPFFAVAVGVLRQPVLIRLSEWLERFLYQKADRVVVNSPGYVEHVRMRGAQVVDLIPNGVDVSMYDPHADGEAFRRISGLEDKFVVLYAGAHGMSNDLEVVLRAAERLSDHSEVVFVFVGDGKEKRNLIARSEIMALQNVLFLPPVAKSSMPEVLAAADVCVAILKPVEAYKTTYPNKVFDYMAAGRSVVLAIDGVIREVVEDARAGVFVPPGDSEALAAAVYRLMEDPEEGKRMGMAGREYVTQHFNRPELAGKMERVMEAVHRGMGETG